MRTMYYAVQDKQFFVESAIGLQKVDSPFEASCFDSAQELIEWLEDVHQVFDFDIVIISDFLK